METAGKQKGPAVVNLAEAVIDDEIPGVMENFPGACRCDRCLADIKALSLNHVTPHYIAVVDGDVRRQADMVDIGTRMDIIRIITRAVIKVSRNPHHGSRTV